MALFLAQPIAPELQVLLRLHQAAMCIACTQALANTQLDQMQLGPPQGSLDPSNQLWDLLQNSQTQLLQQLHHSVMMQQQCQLQKRLGSVLCMQVQEVLLWLQTVQPLGVACRVKHGLNSQHAAQQEALRTMHLSAVT